MKRVSNTSLLPQNAYLCSMVICIPVSIAEHRATVKMEPHKAKTSSALLGVSWEASFRKKSLTVLSDYLPQRIISDMKNWHPFSGRGKGQSELRVRPALAAVLATLHCFYKALCCCFKHSCIFSSEEALVHFLLFELSLSMGWITSFSWRCMWSHARRTISC